MYTFTIYEYASRVQSSSLKIILHKVFKKAPCDELTINLLYGRPILIVPSLNFMKIKRRWPIPITMFGEKLLEP
jgi:hypothetical protein